MTSPLAYRPKRLPLQMASPVAAAAYLGALVLAAFLLSSPVMLVAVLAAAVLAGILAGVGSAVAFGLRLGLVLAVLMVVVNGLVTSRGETVLGRLGDWPLLGPVEVTAESLAAGAVIGLRAVAVMVIMAVYSAAVDPDRVLRATRPLARRSALTAGLVSRLVPLAVTDLTRLGEAARLRGPGAAPAGRPALARRLLAGSLDRTVDLAATLELRGFSLPAPVPSAAAASPPVRSPRRPRQDRRFFLAAAVVVAVLAVIQLSGAGHFATYPLIEYELTPAALSLALALTATGLTPWRRRRGAASWRRRGGRGYRTGGQE
ncbi:MAG TPA: energy-coupling factor transporter transmembrane component T [Solirubrobacterales bacterium]|nr:energy-coupling factor transporter transmembrane component T [Solirubrobacterales bacterium]